jgi:hypothetical protein
VAIIDGAENTKAGVSLLKRKVIMSGTIKKKLVIRRGALPVLLQKERYEYAGVSYHVGHYGSHDADTALSALGIRASSTSFFSQRNRDAVLQTASITPEEPAEEVCSTASATLSGLLRIKLLEIRYARSVDGTLTAEASIEISMDDVEARAIDVYSDRTITCAVTL